MTRRTKYALSGLVAVAALAACGKLTSESTNFLNKKYFDAWVTVCRTDNPEYIWSRTALGSYLLRDIPGSGKLASAEEAPYLQVEYNLRTLDGSLVGTTSRALDKQEYGDIPGDESYYYGPAFWYTGSNNLYASYEELIFGDGKELEPMKTGGERTAVLPGWLLTQKRYKTEKEYLNNITGTDYILTVKVIGQVKDIRKWEIDSLSRYIDNKTPMHSADTTKEFFPNRFGQYYCRTKEPVDSVDFEQGDAVYINYIGRRLDGQVFDTNIADTAKLYGLYDYATDSDDNYKPVLINWDTDYTKMTMGDAASKVIDGFSYALHNMKLKEEGYTVFFSEYGYGSSGTGLAIPGYCPLRFEFQIVEKR